MNHSLQNCVITGPWENPASNFSAAIFSLFYQTSTIGMKIKDAHDGIDESGFSFVLETPVTTPVVCEVTAWDQASESNNVASENIIQAACGLMSVHGRASGKIQSLGLNYVSTLTAALALQGATAAALGQLRGLPHADVRISMVSAALLSVSQYLADATVNTTDENLPAAAKNRIPAPPFISSDDVVFELETLNAEPWLKFWTRLGISATLAGKGWTAFLLRYAKAIAPLPDELFHALTHVTYQDIAALCSQTGLSICPVQTMSDRVTDEQLKCEWLNGPWAFELTTAATASFRNNNNHGLPLSGLTVIESCRRIQGPLAGHLLALLGAEVIRIEPPGGDPLRGMPPLSDGCSVRFDALNRFKTIREIDIKSAAGRAEVMELAKNADVFLHNWAPHKAAQLKLDAADLADVNPALVYAYAAGWSNDGDSSFRLNAIPGTDFMVQAHSGVAHKISQACGIRGGTLFTVLDLLGGVVAAQGITIALLNRYLNHTGGKVTSSLLSAATLLCSEDFQHQYHFFETNVPAVSRFNNIYATKQGMLAIECCDEAALQRLFQIIDDGQIDIMQRLDEILLTNSAQEWVKLFQQAGIPAAVVIEDLADLYDCPQLRPLLNRGSYTQVTSPWSFQ
ncbi:CoA transferase [Nitrosomonas sp.]|uniref:CoA transferase n=1 Tax=Nitrosomonas sp. TaxID=42353 RepID=UPI001DD6F9BA|nr:CoA transferase [Nitrosomonas sp.]MBX3616156.1 CoA transferase [Nitrosomonas sp.]